VKNRLTITSTGNDAVLERIINAATDFIENQCQRTFKETTYTEQVYTAMPNLKDLVLREYPVSSVSKVEYRAGLKSNPNWTEYSTDDWELQEDGRDGVITAVGYFQMGVNALRVTYVAGYKINFANAGDRNTHTLPADITDLCERLVVKWWKRREKEGTSTESFEGSTVTFMDDLTKDDKETLAKYTRITFA